MEKKTLAQEFALGLLYNHPKLSIAQAELFAPRLAIKIDEWLKELDDEICEREGAETAR